MNARDEIANLLKVRDEAITPADADDGERLETAYWLIEALTAAGYSVRRDDETHAPTVEAVAAWHDQMAIDAANAPDGEAQSRFHACCAGLLRNDPRAASAIRALIKEGGE